MRLTILVLIVGIAGTLVAAEIPNAPSTDTKKTPVKTGKEMKKEETSPAASPKEAKTVKENTRKDDPKKPAPPEQRSYHKKPMFAVCEAERSKLRKK